MVAHGVVAHGVHYDNDEFVHEVACVLWVVLSHDKEG